MYKYITSDSSNRLERYCSDCMMPIFYLLSFHTVLYNNDSWIHFFSSRYGRRNIEQFYGTLGRSFQDDADHAYCIVSA